MLCNEVDDRSSTKKTTDNKTRKLYWLVFSGCTYSIGGVEVKWEFQIFYGNQILRNCLSYNDVMKFKEHHI